MLKKINKHWLIGVLTLLSLTPLVWFHKRWGNTLINGVDTNFPLDPLIWLERRFYIWNSTANAGADFAYGTAGTFFHIVQTIPFLLGYSLQATEISSLIFWFGMIVFSSYSFAKAILPNSKFAQLVLVVFYSFNTYLFNTWENVKAANLSLVAALPFTFTLLINLHKKKITRLKAFALSILVGLIASGAGINPAYLGSMFVAMFVLSFSLLLTDLNFKNLIEKLKDYLVIVLGVLIINLFWIIPTGHFIFTSISQNHSLESIGYTNWVDSLSENTSLFNVARLQGAWDWYAVDQNSGEYLYIPYANKYFKNPFFVSFSILVPALALLSLFWRDKNRKELYLAFALLIVLGIFLGAGTHLPTGVLFRWMVNYVPFFSLFRSPWYIFTVFLTIAYASLLALLINNAKKKLNKTVIFLFASVLVFGNLIYSYPMVLGRIYRPARYDSFFVNFPNYVFESSKWLNEQQTDGRVIQYPEDEIEQYSWGYRGIESILQLSVNKEVLFSSLNAPNSPVSLIIKEFYLAVKKNQMSLAYKYAEKLNVKYLFQKDDQSTLSPKIVGMENFPVNTFDKWHFYDLEQVSNIKKIYSVGKLYAVYPYADAPRSLVFVDRNSAVVNPADSVIEKSFDLDSIGKIVKAENGHIKLFSDYMNSKNRRNEIYKEKQLDTVTYVVNIPQDGVYTPHLENYGNVLTNTLSAVVNGRNVELNIQQEGDYLSLENMYLNKGENIFIFGAYKKQTISHKEDVITNDAEKKSEIDYSLDSFDPFSNYLIEVEYFHEHGADAQVVLTQSRQGHKVKVFVEELKSYPNWNKVSFYYDPVKTPSSLNIALTAATTSDALGSKVLFKNLKVQKLKENSLFFVMQPKITLDAPSVIYKKINPTLYEGEVENNGKAHLLVFSENYSNLWNYEFINSSGNVKQFTINNYANGYYVENSNDSYKFRVNYWPQRLYRFGQILSSIALFSAATILVVDRFKSIRKK